MAKEPAKAIGARAEEKARATEARAKDMEAKASTVWILWEQIHGELKASESASNLGEIKIMAMSNGEDMKEVVISDRLPIWPKHPL